jgi:anti-anti-sigma factor
MEFAQEPAGDVVIVKIAGRFDSSVAQTAEDSFARVLAAGKPHLAIDLSALEYISSAGLRVLLVVARNVQQAHGKVVLFGLMASVREVFTISRFDQIFTIEADAAGAMAAAR